MSASKIISVRLRPSEHENWKMAAGKNLNRWIRTTLNEEAALVLAKADDERRLQAQQEREKIVAETFPDKKFKPDFK